MTPPAKVPSTQHASPGDKSAKAIDDVFGWIVEGVTERDLLTRIGQCWPDRDPKPLVLAAFERLAQAAEADPGTVHGWCIEATRQVYQRALASGELDTALRAIKQLHSFAVS